jgi:excisionase family DNA binding protein
MTFLTTKQAALQACVSVSVIYHWCHSGQLQHYRVGTPGRRGKILITREDLDNCLASFKVTPTNSATANPPPNSAKPTPRSSFSHLRIT